MSAPRAQPDNTAVRVALWRALHVEIDAPPPILDDTIGLKIAAPEEGWRDRPDMNPRFTALFRASMATRARFIEDLVAEQAAKGVGQYVLLGAGLDTFAQRRPELASRLKIFEIDQPGPQEWKRQRLVALGYGVPDYLRLVPVNFEQGGDWLAELAKAGFDRDNSAVIASTGVTMYLNKETNAATLRRLAGLAPGTHIAMTFILPIDLVSAEERPGFEASINGARAAGTPFLSFYAPGEMLALARAAGLKDAKVFGAAELTARYLANRNDGLRLSNGEQFLVATV